MQLQKAEENQDAECSSRNKPTTSKDHLIHLLKIGHSLNSSLIKNFILEHNLKAFARQIQIEPKKYGIDIN